MPRAIPAPILAITAVIPTATAVKATPMPKPIAPIAAPTDTPKPAITASIPKPRAVIATAATANPAANATTATAANAKAAAPRRTVGPSMPRTAIAAPTRTNVAANIAKPAMHSIPCFEIRTNASSATAITRSEADTIAIAAAAARTEGPIAPKTVNANVTAIKADAISNKPLTADSPCLEISTNASSATAKTSNDAAITPIATAAAINATGLINFAKRPSAPPATSNVAAIVFNAVAVPSMLPTSVNNANAPARTISAAANISIPADAAINVAGLIFMASIAATKPVNKPATSANANPIILSALINLFGSIAAKSANDPATRANAAPNISKLFDTVEIVFVIELPP